MAIITNPGGRFTGLPGSNGSRSALEIGERSSAACSRRLVYREPRFRHHCLDGRAQRATAAFEAAIEDHVTEEVAGGSAWV